MIGFFLGTRGGSRRGGPPYEGAGRGRSQRFNKFDGKDASSTNETASVDQGGEPWSNETGTRGGRGRGGPRRGNFEGGRGTGGRGRGGRGNFNNRNEDGSQQENNSWQQNTEYVKPRFPLPKRRLRYLKNVTLAIFVLNKTQVWDMFEEFWSIMFQKSTESFLF